VQAGDTRFIVVIHGRTTVRAGDTVALQVEVDQVHLFDRATGAAHVAA
jgi:hypothetical protein